MTARASLPGHSETLSEAQIEEALEAVVDLPLLFDATANEIPEGDMMLI
jgi:hypothetical protein